MNLDELSEVFELPGCTMVAIPMPNSREVMECIRRASGTASFILFGDPDAIGRAADEAGTDLSGAEVIEADGDEAACEAAAALAGEGGADLLMKGLTQTSTFTRAILNKAYRLVDPERLLSHVAVFDLPAYHKPLVITDAGINIAPGVEEKREILVNAIEVCRSLGIPKPKAACVAPVERVNPKIRSTVDAAELARLAASGVFGEALVEGPLGFDMAVSGNAAGIKGGGGPVAGDPDILLLPSLDSANAVYKSLTCFASARVGAILAGARVPVVLTSRADSEETKILSLALALTLAGRHQRRPGG